ncbi:MULTISPECIES: outer membrane beta-barrel protein [unclassified Roseitalea]|uniref:outer membrane beta-barrel protein n=1 Tax=unclassified Roseitalea TaxID=2639107 RepID=UPI00273D512C|nr:MULTISPECIES: outer membrane beta-barrel protein [unclassified Roseitalea]
MHRLAVLAAAIFLAAAPPAYADFQLSVFGGWQGAADSDVTVTGANPAAFSARWQGRSFETPPYWGVRGIWWFDQAPQWGVGLDYTHAKVYADAATLADAGWSRFEFSDGINFLTLNAMRRFQRWNALEPYAGLGAGISVPHVEVTRPSDTTFEYQLAGAVIQAQIGANYHVSDRVSLFGEYRFNYSMNRMKLTGGDELEVDLVTNALVAGVSIHF